MDIISYSLSKKYTDEKTGLKRSFKVEKPDGFTWDAPINIYTDGSGNFETDFDVSKYQPTGKTYYVDINKGSTANSGLTKLEPLETIRQAIDKGDADVVIVASGGVYPRNQFTPIDRDITIKVEGGGKSTCAAIDFLNYVKPNSYENIYRATRTGVYRVVDTAYKDRFDNPTVYEELESPEDVDKNPGSWCSQDSYIYIHSMDGGKVDNTIYALLAVRNLFIDKLDVSVYVEGIDFFGGIDVVRLDGSETSTPNIFAKNCSFSSDYRGNGLSFNSGGYALLQNCHANYNAEDGFNYHALGGHSPKVLEVECVGVYNGVGNGGSTQNGSTIHDGGKIVRVNGFYGYNRGPNIPDVNPDTESWNLGVVATCSTSENPDQNADFTGDGQSKTWLDSCISYGSKTSIDARADSVIKTRNMRYDGEVNSIGMVDRY